MMKFELAVNSRVEVILEEFICKSVIQEVENECFYIAIPMIKGQYVRFEKNQKLVMYNYVGTDTLYKFECTVLGMAKSGIMPLYKLTMPENIEKIQRREFVRVEVSKEIEYIVENNNKPIKATLVDLSGGGMRIKTKEKINFGDIITINIKEDEILVKGKIVRSDKISDYYDYGVSYYQMSDKTRERIIRKIFTIMRKQRELN